jgi:hypothetical protein
MMSWIRGIFRQDSTADERRQECRRGKPGGWLYLVVLLGAAAVLITEGLSLLHALRRGPLVAAWLVVLIAAHEAD